VKDEPSREIGKHQRIIMDETSTTPRNLSRNTIGGIVGNILEWYDFAVFGYFAPIIGAQFFPSEDSIASTLKAFGVFAAGYLMRPVGGAIFGYFGDKIGRKRALEISVLLMAIPTTLLGILPTHAQIGSIAALLMVILRLVQGLSVGGEYTGSIAFITEIAPPHRRGLWGSLTSCGAIAGIMLGSAVATVAHYFLDANALASWGWRVPFILGIVVGLFGFWLREGLKETDQFEKLKDSGQIQRNPLMDALTFHRREFVRLLLF
jgi:MHS family proline/betaine transporter-like MFS transporter